MSSGESRKRPLLVGTVVLFLLLTALAVSVLFMTHMGKGKSRKGAFFGKKVAVIDVEGAITESREILGELVQYRKDGQVKAIVLRIDSPGGAVGPSQEIYTEVKRTNEVKPVVASMGSVAASGGYYIACGAGNIVANPGTITGSIGVLMEFSNIEELLKKIGLKSEIIKSGKHKDIGSPVREMTPEERTLLQSVIDTVYSQFIGAISEGRGISREEIYPIADGRFFSGEQALEYKLIDRLGNFQDAISLAAELGGIEGEPHVIYPPKESFSFWEFLFGAIVNNFKEEWTAQSYRLLYLASPG